MAVAACAAYRQAQHVYDDTLEIPPEETMKPGICMTLAAALSAPFAVGAANIDGKSLVICATLEAVQCVKDPADAHECVHGTAASLNVPGFVKVDFEKQQVTATRETGVDSVSAITSVALTNGNLVVQGVEDGKGWALVMEENTGRMTATAVGDEEGMMIFGACTQI